MNIFVSLTVFLVGFLTAQQTHTEIALHLKNKGLQDPMAYELLKDLTSNIGHRLSGSKNFEEAVQWGKKELVKAGADSVWLEPVTIPHWVRGIEIASALIGTNKKEELAICALGGSIGTPKNGIQASVIEVKSFEDLKQLGEKAKGKIIFYNRSFDRTKVNTFEAYSGAVDQRSKGAIEAAKVGAVAVIVRSMTNTIDKVPHTGMMSYNDTVPKIPAAAVSTEDADLLSGHLKNGQKVSIHLQLGCKTLSDVQSYNVIGQIRGTERPDEIILVGGHLDSWDKGTGAHDDGSGVAHSIEVIRLLKSLPERPKRTIRVVLFANEENGLKGGKAYAARLQNKNEKHLAAIESDAGGFLPIGFGVTTDSAKFTKIKSYSSYLEIIGAERISKGGGGADISTLESYGTALIGLNLNSQRYFDYHHSDHDTIDKVHPRELELGAIAIAILSWVIAQDGL